MKKTTSALLLSGLLAAASQVTASPITYEGQLFNATPVTGTSTQPPSNPSNPVGANYFFFVANAGSPVTVWGDRLTGTFDMSFWVIPGLFNDTNDFPGGNLGAIPGARFGDDQDPPNVPGPFGDPRVSFTPSSSGPYTVAVTNFLASGQPPYDFRLEATGVVPEPASLALLGLGLAGLAVGRRRQRA